ncbi:MAG: response regulator [Nitrospirae bacterium YQR-1]
MNSQKVIKLLIIEDDSGEIALIEELLKDEANVKLKIEKTQSLSSAFGRLPQGNIDVVILDLMLPDSKGLDTFTAIYALIPEVPIVVLSGMDDDKFATQAVSMGAQDYLVKGTFNGHLLLRSLLYAIERNRLQLELAKMRHEASHRQEMISLDRLSGSPKASITSQMLGKSSLRDGNRQIFDDFVNKYCDITESALQQRIYKTEAGIAEPLLAMAEQLGFMKSGPRDVVEIHSEALKLKLNGMNMAKAQLCMEESRFILLELMGNLASYYRNYFILFRKNLDL